MYWFVLNLNRFSWKWLGKTFLFFTKRRFSHIKFSGMAQGDVSGIVLDLYVLIALGWIPSSVIAAHMISLCLTLLKRCLDSKTVIIFLLLPLAYESSRCSSSLSVNINILLSLFCYYYCLSVFLYIPHPHSFRESCGYDSSLFLMFWCVFLKKDFCITTVLLLKSGS